MKTYARIPWTTKWSNAPCGTLISAQRTHTLTKGDCGAQRTHTLTKGDCGAQRTHTLTKGDCGGSRPRTSRTDAGGVHSGRRRTINKTNACFVFSNFSELSYKETVEPCWDMTAKAPFMFATLCMQTICKMNNSAPNIEMSHCLYL